MLRKRLAIRIEGTVQGVGFRPFIYRIARERALCGWVLNDSQGVRIEIEGPSAVVECFVAAIHIELPPLASISRILTSEIAVVNDPEFTIIESQYSALQSAQIPPDTHVCPDCLSELFDPLNRRFHYPFINCTNCGPRYTIVSGTPYDRPFTTMVDFPMCVCCQGEYTASGSRRFHAQPIACADCGPVLSLYDHAGNKLENAKPLSAAIDLLKRGEILAIKGLGGFHLAVDPQNLEAVARLRARKHRDEKPFALMAGDIKSAESFALINPLERKMLESIERPIVLLEKKTGQRLICDNTAPNNRYLGVMLPYTPLHYLLLEQFSALIMTSGNQSDEPISYNDEDALLRLQGIADGFLCHNRRIQIRTDDSIIRVLAGEPLMLRRSRGYVPRAVKLPQEQLSVLAVGAELKNTICLTSANRATLSHHIGDLKNQSVLDSLQQAAEHLQTLLNIRPQLVAHDLHPDYSSTSVAQQMDLPTLAVQHHHAHLASCLADNGRDERVIGVIFDGVGLGSDGHIWGGEFLIGDFGGFERVGHLAELAMPGGDAATREPWRMAFSLLLATYGDNLPDLAFLDEIPAADRKLLTQMIQKGINAPLTSSCGRLFDAVSALAGLRQRVSYEGQAALELEMCLEQGAELPPYSFPLLNQESMFIVDHRTMTKELVVDLQRGRGAGIISSRFHLGLADAILQVCLRLRDEYGALPVALSGGVFQNAFLTEKLSQRLQTAEFEVLRHRQVPPNDGGLSLGQAAIAGHFLRNG